MEVWDDFLTASKEITTMVNDYVAQDSVAPAIGEGFQCMVIASKAMHPIVKSICEPDVRFREPTSRLLASIPCVVFTRGELNEMEASVQPFSHRFVQVVSV